MFTKRLAGPAQLERKPRSFYPKFRTWVLKTFTDRFMTELAILLIPTTLLPLLFTFSEVSLLIFHVINLVIVVFFILEYVLKLSVSKPRWKYAIQFMHIVDLVIILLAVIDFVPFLPIKGWRASPLLRLLRLLRVFFLTGRVTHRVAAPAESDQAGAANGPVMRLTIESDAQAAREASLDDVRTSIADDVDHWIRMEGVSGADIDPLSRLFSIPGHILESKLLQYNFPGIDNFGGYTIATLWDTTCRGTRESEFVPAIEDPRLVIIRTGRDILLLSEQRPYFADRLAKQRQEFSGEPLGIQVLISILKLKMDDYKFVLSCLEKKVAGLERQTFEKRDSRFLDIAFKLRKIIQTQGYNIGHFVHILDYLVKKEQEQQKWSKTVKESLISFWSDARALNDLIITLRESTSSLIELELNKVSFNLNRVMKILAMITCLALVPTIIGGLLGQNLKDQPYNITIHEIFFFVFSLMLVGLYVFYRKGWLR